MALFNKYQAAASDGPDVQPLHPDRIAAVLDELEANYGRADDGDIGGMWDGNLVEFLARGDDREVFIVRSRWKAAVPLTHRPQVLEECNTWNSERIWPKTYVDTVEDALVVVCELATDFEHGVTDAQLQLQVRCGLSTSLHFFEHLEQTWPQFQEWVPADDD